MQNAISGARDLPSLPPEAAGFAADLAAKLEAGIASGLLRHLHSVLVVRSGSVVLEHFGRGVDEAWGKPLGDIAFGPQTAHDLRSVTKSVVGLLYGIALDRGLVPSPEAPLMAQFPEYADLAADPARSELTIGHALSMTLGLAWDEERSYTDPENSEIAMENAPDRYRFVLEREVVAPPGAGWTYSGGAVALLGALIARGCGQRLPDFAQEALFSPLGIADVQWAAGWDGIESAASGLRLRPRDLARIGMMVLQGGEYGGRRVLSQAWVERSLSASTDTGDGIGYGYLWFLGEAFVPALGRPAAWAAGFGNGGQRLWLMPEADLAVVIFSGDYNAPDAWVTPTRIWREIVLANLLRR